MLGAHISTAGGVSKAPARARELDTSCMQIFVKNANRWQAKSISAEEVARFQAERATRGIEFVVAHASYLINLATDDETNLEKSRAALGDELDRCHALGVDALVVHPGAHLGAGVETGVARVANSIDAVYSTRPDCTVRLLLENTAGQGTVLGATLEELAQMRERTAYSDRVGVCLDTCHAFAAGYALHTEDGYHEFWREVDTRLGSDQPECIHLNDSAKPFASNRDRHANIGQGEIGPPAFERLVRDDRVSATPMILETPLGDDRDGHRMDLEVLRSFRVE